jgi:hypothetical protein
MLIGVAQAALDVELGPRVDSLSVEVHNAITTLLTSLSVSVSFSDTCEQAVQHRFAEVSADVATRVDALTVESGRTDAEHAVDEYERIATCVSAAGSESRRWSDSDGRRSLVQWAIGIYHAAPEFLGDSDDDALAVRISLLCHSLSVSFSLSSSSLLFVGGSIRGTDVMVTGSAIGGAVQGTAGENSSVGRGVSACGGSVAVAAVARPDRTDQPVTLPGSTFPVPLSHDLFVLFLLCGVTE